MPRSHRFPTAVWILLGLILAVVVLPIIIAIGLDFSAVPNQPTADVPTDSARN